MNVYYSNIVANYQQRLGETSLGNVLFYDGHNLYQSIQGLNGFGSLGFLRKVFSNVGRSFKKIKGELTRKKPKYNFRKNFLRAHRANKKAFDIGFKNTKKSVVKVLPKVKKVIKIAAPIVASVAAVIPGGQVVSAAAIGVDLLSNFLPDEKKNNSITKNLVVKKVSKEQLPIPTSFHQAKTAKSPRVVYYTGKPSGNTQSTKAYQLQNGRYYTGVFPSKILNNNHFFNDKGSATDTKLVSKLVLSDKLNVKDARTLIDLITKSNTNGKVGHDHAVKLAEYQSEISSGKHYSSKDLVNIVRSGIVGKSHKASSIALKDRIDNNKVKSQRNLLATGLVAAMFLLSK